MKKQFMKRAGAYLLTGCLLAGSMPAALADTAVSTDAAPYEMTIDTEKVALTGAWAGDSSHTFTVKLKVNGKAATKADFDQVTITPTLTAGFEEVGTYGDFASNTSLIYVGTQKGWGVAQFTATAKKSSVVNYILSYKGNLGTETNMVLAGDVNRDGMLTSRDSNLLICQQMYILTDFSDRLWNEELCNLSGDNRVTAFDSFLLTQMIMSVIESN